MEKIPGYCQFLILLLCVATLNSSRVRADCQIEELPTPTLVGGAALGSFASAINASGEVVGEGIYEVTPHAPPYAYTSTLWQNGTSATLLTNGYALAINDSGQVLGVLNHQPYVWQNGSFTYFGGDTSLPAGISPSGQVVGASGSGRAVLWQSGTMIDLGPGFATAINGSGQIVGGTQLASPPVVDATKKLLSSTASHAVLWQDGTMTDLGLGYATAINAWGLIVGTSNGQAVLWQNGMKTVLGVGIAEAVHDLG